VLEVARASDAEIEKIRATIDQMRESIANNDSTLDADMAFHLAIAEAAHNEVLRNAVQLLRNLMRQWLVLKLMMPQVPSNVLKQHETIFRAIQARDAEAARNAMQTHLQTTAHLLKQVVERSGKSSQNGRGRRILPQALQEL